MSSARSDPAINGGTSATAIVGAVIAGHSLCTAALSLVVSFTTRRTAALAARQEHIRGVTLFHQRVWGDNHDELVIRNDGRHAVTVANFGVAYGNRWRQNRRPPETWGFQTLVGSHLRPPSDELRVAAPDPVVGARLIGRTAIITDALGQRWELTENT